MPPKPLVLTLTSQAEIAGLPASLLSLAAQAARDKPEKKPLQAASGPWRITLDMPSYGPFLKHSLCRDLREKLYRAYINRACIRRI